MSDKLLTENNLEFLSLKGGCTGSSECTLVTLPHCRKSHAMAHFISFHRRSNDVPQLPVPEVPHVKHKTTNEKAQEFQLGLVRAVC